MPPSTRRIERDEALLPTHAVQRVELDESDRREPGHDSHEAERFRHRHDREDAETQVSAAGDAIDDTVLTYGIYGQGERSFAPGGLPNASEAAPQSRHDAADAPSNQTPQHASQTQTPSQATSEGTGSGDDTPIPNHVDLYA